MKITSEFITKGHFSATEYQTQLHVFSSEYKITFYCNIIRYSFVFPDIIKKKALRIIAVKYRARQYLAVNKVAFVNT